MKNNVPQPLLMTPQPEMVVAVPSIDIAFTIWNSATGKSEKTTAPRFALWNPETNEYSRVYGGNTCQNTVYREGIMPKTFRMAVENEEQAFERIFQPIPATIEEVALDETPELKLVLTNYQLIPIPEILPEKAAKKECLVLTHPAVFFNRVQPKAQPQKQTPGQLNFPFAENNVQPINATA